VVLGKDLIEATSKVLANPSYPEPGKVDVCESGRFCSRAATARMRSPRYDNESIRQQSLLASERAEALDV
jgi:hypothetical protein